MLANQSRKFVGRLAGTPLGQSETTGSVYSWGMSRVALSICLSTMQLNRLIALSIIFLTQCLNSASVSARAPAKTSPDTYDPKKDPMIAHLLDKDLPIEDDGLAIYGRVLYNAKKNGKIVTQDFKDRLQREIDRRQALVNQNLPPKALGPRKIGNGILVPRTGQTATKAPPKAKAKKSASAPSVPPFNLNQTGARRVLPPDTSVTVVTVEKSPIGSSRMHPAISHLFIRSPDGTPDLWESEANALRAAIPNVALVKRAYRYERERRRRQALFTAGKPIAPRGAIAPMSPGIDTSMTPMKRALMDDSKMPPIPLPPTSKPVQGPVSPRPGTAPKITSKRHGATTSTTASPGRGAPHSPRGQAPSSPRPSPIHVKRVSSPKASSSKGRDKGRNSAKNDMAARKKRVPNVAPPPPIDDPIEGDASNFAD